MQFICLTLCINAYISFCIDVTIYKAAINFLFKNSLTERKGSHGYNNSISTMRPFFIARGPVFKKNYTASPFQNVDIYPLLCQILDAKPYKNNGSLSRIEHILLKEKLFHETTTFITFVASIIFAALVSSLFSLIACRVYRIHRRYNHNCGYHVSINGLPMNDTDKQALLEDQELESELP